MGNSCYTVVQTQGRDEDADSQPTRGDSANELTADEVTADEVTAEAHHGATSNNNILRHIHCALFREVVVSRKV